MIRRVLSLGGDMSGCRDLIAAWDPVAITAEMVVYGALALVALLKSAVHMVRESRRLPIRLLVSGRTVAKHGLRHLQQCNFLSLYTSGYAPGSVVQLQLVRGRRSRVRLIIRLTGLNDVVRHTYVVKEVYPGNAYRLTNTEGVELSHPWNGLYLKRFYP
ncbi:hypothetical protein Taro_016172 [Colocasia esculenta]|uniref:Uncharacterized protein n=1 Tax=Colocasia esculenta TaxID=4460 RepID=A0A843UPJ0_COLES|nr:hypothetical protein [Colocasia esculenta]